MDIKGQKIKEYDAPSILRNTETVPPEVAFQDFLDALIEKQQAPEAQPGTAYRPEDDPAFINFLWQHHPVNPLNNPYVIARPPKTQRELIESAQKSLLQEHLLF